MPPVPVFVRPQLVPPNPQLVAAHLQQQQLLQQQQMEQFQRFQLMQQQQAIAQQQAMAAQAQQVQQRVPFGDGSPAVNGGQQMLPPNGVPNQPQNGRPPVVKRPSSQNGASMPPPSQPRQSLSPSNSMHPNQQLPLNGQSPQMVNGMMLPNGKNGFPQPGQSLDPAMQQRILQARAVALAQQQAAVQQLPNGMGEQMNGDQTNGGMTAEQLELARLSQQAGFGTNIQAFVEARNKARIMNMAKMAQQQQQLQLQGQANGNVSNGNGTPQPGYGSPGVSNGQLQLKFPPHAAARPGASESQQRM